MHALGDRTVRYTTELDHHDHEAMIALDVRGEEALGDAFYVRDGRRPDTAEVAVTVVDEWQGRGLGMLLLEAISARALDEGVGTFTALMLARNADDGPLRAVGSGSSGGRPGRSKSRSRSPPSRSPPSSGSCSGGRGGMERQLHGESRAMARAALEGQAAAPSLDAILQAHQARAARRIGATGSLVAALQPEGTAAPADAHVAGGGVRMLGDVRRRLRDDVVRRHFDASGQAAVEVRRPA